MAQIKLTISILFLVGCMTTGKTNITNSQSYLRKSIPEDTLIELTITTIDESSLDLYNIVRFYYNQPKNNGIILEKKSSITKLISGQIILVTLCDVGQFGHIHSENDTISVGNEPLIYGKQDGRKNNVDTSYFRGHIMLYGQILNDGKLILGFADDADEPVFEICNK